MASRYPGRRSGGVSALLPIRCPRISAILRGGVAGELSADRSNLRCLQPAEFPADPGAHAPRLRARLFELDWTGARNLCRRGRSPKAVRALLGGLQSITITPEEYIGRGDVIIANVRVRVRGRGRDSGIEVEARGPHVWRFRDGKVIGFTLYQELDAALEATGL